ncbi:hypothetical protein [Clostridium botulinum]|uniref:hypothetical protein n=1 Tax=Clostridium botulinum TaxID=1491 RepID=UPI001C9A9E36|nr:hypothetical protein [Clostridium botulinum]MBY6838654.1 hypothetical protein [Clostridium botulinum]
MEKVKEVWIVDLREGDYDIWQANIETGSREEAIKLGTEKAKEEGIKQFSIGTQISCGMSSISADMVIESAYDELYNEVGEVAEGYLDTTKEQNEELELKLNEVFYEWHKKHNLFPTCYKVENTETIDVE